VVPGFVYRNEAEDASHGDQFYQIEDWWWTLTSRSLI
jgi:phenylalanyl-tRNA synthetase alpha subunit